MNTRKEPIISASLLVLFLFLRTIYPESVVTAGMVVGLLLIVRALYVYWSLIGGILKEDKENKEKDVDGDLTGLYVLVRFYKQHGWPAMMGTLGNVTLACLVFFGSLMVAPASP